MRFAARNAWVYVLAKNVSIFACADEFGVDLIGGDTTRGPRNFCVTLFGEVASGRNVVETTRALQQRAQEDVVPERRRHAAPAPIPQA